MGAHAFFPKAAEYTTTPFHPHVSMEVGSAPFDFCGEHKRDVLRWVSYCQKCDIEWCNKTDMDRVEVAGINSSAYDLGPWLTCEWLDQLAKPVQQLRDSKTGGI